MSAKTFFILLLTIGALQNSELSPITTAENTDFTFDGIVREAFEVLQEAVEYIRYMINEAVMQAESIIEDIVRTILDIEKDIKNEAHETSKELLNSVIIKVEEVKNLSVITGKNFAECIAGKENATKDQVVEMRQKVDACISLEVVKGGQLMQELLGLIANAVHVSEGAAFNISQCFGLTSSFGVLECVITEAVVVTNNASFVVNSIRSIVGEAGTFLQIMFSDLSLCVEPELLKARDQVTETLTNITTCGKRKCSNNNC